MSDETLNKVVDLCYAMLELADRGDRVREDASSGLVYGALRDAAYKVRKLAEKEIERRQAAKAGHSQSTPNP
jgi:hypothetical protein